MSKEDNLIFQNLRERRSVRLFNGKKIPKKTILKIIEAGVYAPTGCNNQELKFLLISDEERKERIRRFKPFFKGVSDYVLVFYDMSLPMSQKMYRENTYEKNLPYIDTGLALMNMANYAKSIGIESCIFNMSEFHFERMGQNFTKIEKLKRKILRKLGLHKTLPDNLHYYLHKELRMSEQYIVTCGVAFGYSNRLPNIKTMMHGGKKIERMSTDNYLIELDKSEK